MLDWILIYERVQPLLPALQVVMLAGGMTMLYQWYRDTKEIATPYQTL